jgi:hypothetical protein
LNSEKQAGQFYRLPCCFYYHNFNYLRPPDELLLDEELLFDVERPELEVEVELLERVGVVVAVLVVLLGRVLGKVLLWSLRVDVLSEPELFVVVSLLDSLTGVLFVPL